MTKEEAKIGMRVYCTDNGVEGTIVDNDNEFSDYGCYVDLDNGEEHLFMGFEQIEKL